MTELTFGPRTVIIALNTSTEEIYLDGNLFDEFTGEHILKSKTVDEADIQKMEQGISEDLKKVAAATRDLQITWLD